MPTLSVLCVSAWEEMVTPGLTNLMWYVEGLGAEFVVHTDHSGALEYGLDEGIAKCHGDYIFRIDDDEQFSWELLEWLRKGEFTGDVYSFPRLNLWGDGQHYIQNSPLFPDYQTRLTTKDKAHRERALHVGCPHGIGEIVQKPILHYKFLIRNHEERAAIADRYEQLQSGAGTGYYRQFSLPEDFMEIQIGQVE